MIFETLYLLFKADTNDLQKNTKKATGLTDELKKSFKGLTDVSSLVDESFLKLTSTIGGLIAAGLSAHAVYEGFKTALDYSTKLSLSSRQLGVNVTELQKWGNAVEHYGGSAETFANSIQAISEKTGLSRENSVKFLPVLSEVLSHMNKVQQAQFGQTWGVDQSLVQLLAESNDKIGELLGFQDKLKPLTKENAQAFIHFNDSLINSKQAIQSVFTQIELKALPSLQKFLDKVVEFATYLVNNDKAIEGVFKGIATVVIGLSAAFLLLNPTIAIITGISAAVIALFGYINTIDAGEIEKKLDLSEGFLHKYVTFAGYIESILYAYKKLIELSEKAANILHLDGAGNLQDITSGKIKLTLGEGNTTRSIDSSTSSVLNNNNNYQNSNQVHNVLNTGDLVINGANTQDANSIKKSVNDVYKQIFSYSQSVNQFSTSTL